MTVSRDATHPTYEELLALWQDAPPPMGPSAMLSTARRPRRHHVSRFMLLAYVAMASCMLAIYTALMWAIDVVGR